MADDTRLDELLTSPLDQPDSFRVWWPLVVGVVLGVSGALLGYLLASAGDDPGSGTSETTMTTPVTTSSTGDAEETAFPPGYAPVSGLIAVKPFVAVVHGDTVHVAFTTAVRRGFDQDQAAPFNAGRWVLETASGADIESTGVATTYSAPGAFTVVFPWEEEAPPEPATLRLVEGLSFFDEQGRADVPFTGLPMTVEDLVVAELPTTTIHVDSLTITEEEAVLTWSSSAGVPVGATFTVHLDDPSQNGVAYYYERSGPFLGSFGERTLPNQASGTVTLPRDRSVQASGGMETASQLSVEAYIEHVVAYPASAELDVTDLPVVGS